MAMAHPLKLTLCAASVTLAATVHVAPAVADDGGPLGEAEVRVTPAGPGPGDEVELRVWGCEGNAGTARSKALVTKAHAGRRRGAGRRGHGELDRRARRVSGRCGV